MNLDFSGISSVRYSRGIYAVHRNRTTEQAIQDLGPVTELDRMRVLGKGWKIFHGRRVEVLVFEGGEWDVSANWERVRGMKRRDKQSSNTPQGKLREKAKELVFKGQNLPSVPKVDTTQLLKPSKGDTANVLVGSKQTQTPSLPSSLRIDMLAQVGGNPSCVDDSTGNVFSNFTGKPVEVGKVAQDFKQEH